MNCGSCSSHQNAEDPSQHAGPWTWLSETSEIGLGALCSIVTWRFTVQNDLTRGDSSSHENHGESRTVDLLHPSPGLMLCSCLLFGCCVSSFAHRRQDKDPLQFAVYMIVLAAAAIIGYGLRASSNLILLGYLPWATCLAMAISISGHNLHRRWVVETRNALLDEEKVRLLG
ncbi:hypothetical protein B0T26DRAFT_635564 [Lasiosphaeria miniovina]|uniref:Uncharacterized protein n=1 Tax=Lasiosphaeria miniovina TaxID=1954250 RepID=A0AA40BHH6_9PEZI|nr:uncharacterized protein B0T26DRAFT_635564 [Lasiosphaeria miniovina]KAK0734108.1 hypothetical protein B0T26DRAFT_635564 [Lasiosphaeria miniovina]